MNEPAARSFPWAYYASAAVVVACYFAALHVLGNLVPRERACAILGIEPGRCAVSDDYFFPDQLALRLAVLAVLGFIGAGTAFAVFLVHLLRTNARIRGRGL